MYKGEYNLPLKKKNIFTVSFPLLFIHHERENFKKGLNFFTLPNFSISGTTHAGTKSPLARVLTFSFHVFLPAANAILLSAQ